MGKHRLEIELTDDLLSRIDSVSARTSHSRMDVVVETLREHLPQDRPAKTPDPEAAIAILDAFLAEASRFSSQLSEQEVLDEIREFRGDE